ncbi:MAG: LysR family transcriptional regulator [Rhizobiales bacterium]|nr:LysR family transcriptional regulator [Hyphomicrobiales bacterium]NRB15605.1 LysR family transcriptional regulator [Hyphomicrobiales bacterium]
MNWEDTKLFLAVARAGQISAAATGLGINHATLSRRISALETSLGTKLLVRRTYGCELTEAGTAFFHKIERAEQVLLSSETAFEKQDTKASGIVRVGAPDGFGLGFLAPKLPSLLDQYPELKIQLVPVPRNFSLSQREADIAIMVGRPEKGRLIVKKLTDYGLSLYASKQYIQNFGRPKTLPELAQHRLVGYVEDLIYSPLLNYSNEVMRNWRSSIEVSTATGQVAVVKAGAGIGILHDYLAHGDDDLVQLFPTSLTREYWLAFHESQRDLQRIKIVSDFLAQIVKNSDF